ncbi:hypothetical protein GCM10010912_20210 [Paenibacillus albidus]|uniref:Uncharacterized protein n=1 Tax=Paenibacillus albidus TaxID=2041023 RepID=A0A917FFS1_9BACL|nr:hypothetical protein GCM10010912_20210 [Paenibacillus albidus]
MEGSIDGECPPCEIRQVLWANEGFHKPWQRFSGYLENRCFTVWPWGQPVRNKVCPSAFPETFALNIVDIVDDDKCPRVD